MIRLLLVVTSLIALRVWASHVHRQSKRGRCLRQEQFRKYLAHED